MWDVNISSESRRPLTLHLVRHGRTRLNAAQRVQGWADSELTSDGLAGVRALAAELRGRRFVRAYASPSGRAVTTAREILAHHPGVLLDTDARLRELGFGEYEEQPESSLAVLGDHVAVFRAIFDGTYSGFPGGESAATFLARIAQGFHAIEQAHLAGGDVLVVSHGVSIVTYLRLIGVVIDAPLPNASVTRVRVGPDGERTMIDDRGASPAPAAVAFGDTPAGVTLEDALTWPFELGLTPEGEAS